MFSVRWADVINFQLASTIMGAAALSAHKEWLVRKAASIRKRVAGKTGSRSRRHRAIMPGRPSSYR